MPEILECTRSRRGSEPGTPGRRSATRETPPLVLVIDDDRHTRDAIVAVLEIEGYEVETAPDGKAALELLRQGVVPGAIVLDVMMPVMDGWDFRRHQLADPALASIPVMVMSADPFAAEMARRLAVRDVLAKPVEIEDLLGTLERLTR
jgi:CheY-like chemotaxis protein